MVESPAVAAIVVLRLLLDAALVGLVVAGHATHSNPSARRWLAFAGVVVGVVVLLVPTVVLYGEATVAP